MRHGVPVAHLESEEEYFYRQDAELIGKMRKRAAAEEEHRLIANTAHTEDPKILEELEKLGYTHTTVMLLSLVPLVELAWVDGSVSPEERGRLLALAGERGIEENTPAHQQLVEWLDHCPSRAFFEGTWHTLEKLLESLPVDDRESGKNALIRSCKEFASATCAHIGWVGRVCAAKRELLRKSAHRLNSPHSSVCAA